MRMPLLNVFLWECIFCIVELICSAGNSTNFSLNQDNVLHLKTIRNDNLCYLRIVAIQRMTNLKNRPNASTNKFDLIRQLHLT